MDPVENYVSAHISQRLIDDATDQISDTSEMFYSEEGADSTSNFTYISEMLTHACDKESIRSTQARLTLMEIFEHFDCLNDFLFILRIAFFYSNEPYESSVAGFTLLWLIVIWLTSLATYLLRRYIIYHQIRRQDLKLFYPVYVFMQIKRSGDRHPEALYMFERLYWTYSLLLRFLEDLPQIVLSTLFVLSYGRDLYSLFIIGISCCFFFAVSIRMGLKYPLFGTVSLILSSKLPSDLHVDNEASPLNYSVTLFGAIVWFVWASTGILSLDFVSPTWKPVIVAWVLICLLLGSLCSLLWVYYSRQARYDVNQKFLRGLTPVGSFSEELESRNLKPYEHLSDGASDSTLNAQTVSSNGRRTFFGSSMEQLVVG